MKISNGFIVLLCFIQVSCTTKESEKFKIDNSTDVFIEYHEQVQNLTEEKKLSLFHSVVVKSNPIFYQYKFDQWKENDVDSDIEILRHVEAFEGYKDRFVFLNRKIPTQIDSALQLFKKEFSDFKSDFEIYYLHSLGEMNGGVRVIGGQDRFIIGLDVIAQIHDWENNIPFFHHELFHLYLNQFYAPSDSGQYVQDAIYNDLWQEGLATYVSYALNPQASHKELMLDIPQDLSQKTEAVIKYIANDLVKNMFSTEDEVYQRYFLMSSKSDVVPQRAGYFVGFLLVKQLAERHTLQELVGLKDVDFVPEFLAQLRCYTEKKE